MSNEDTRKFKVKVMTDDRSETVMTEFRIKVGAGEQLYKIRDKMRKKIAGKLDEILSSENVNKLLGGSDVRDREY